MVKVARKDEDKQRVWNYMDRKGTIPATNTFFFKENEAGEIIGAYGIETKTCVEPMQAEDKMTAYELLIHSIAVVQMLGADKVHFITCNPTATKLLKNRFDAVLWSKNVDELFINLNQQTQWEQQTDQNLETDNEPISQRQLTPRQ